MKEVSSKAFEPFFEPLAAKGVSLDRVVADTGVPASALRDKNARVTWPEFVAIMKNIRPWFTDAEYVEIGRSFFRSPGLRFAFVVARLLLTPMGFYRWQNSRQGAGGQLFTCIVPTHRDISENECEVDLEVPEGFEVCWDFCVVTIGTFSEMPRLLGYPAAKVELTRIPRGGRFHITVPDHTPALTRMRRAVTWPFTVRAAARELREAHETLLDRYKQLDAAGTQLDRQATRLRTAHTVSELILGDLDLDRTLEAIARALVTEAGFAGVELHLSANMSGVEVTRVARHGVVADGTPLQRSLAVQGGQKLGELLAFPQAGAEAQEREDLLTFLVPTLTMALHNALSYLAAEEYRRGLERRVEERTHDLRVATHELAATVQRLQEVQQSRERLFQNISHEIRTPLSLILLSVDSVLASHRARLDAGATEHLTTVTTSARKLVRLVDELLLLAAGHERELKINAVPTDLTQVLGEIIAGWRLAAEVAGLVIVLDAPAGLVARVDPVAIERVVSNLLSNAIKFTPPGGKITVAVTPGDPIGLSVIDTGLGIDEELRGRLFGRFEQGSGGRATRGGSGIGLSIVRELVRAHGGDIEYRPNPGGGTEFALTLPPAIDLAPRPAPQPRLLPSDFGVPTSSELPAAHRAPAASAQAVIVVAEDDFALAEAIARLLAEEHVVYLAHDGVSALSLIEQHRPDLVVTDIQMPGMDGVELTRRLQEIPGGPPPPVLVLSARADLQDRLVGLAAGAVDYLIKPFDPSELRARVRTQLAHRALGQRLFRAEKLASLGSLSAGLAHELRNPANGIVNAVGPLKELLPAELVAPDQPVSQLLEVMTECADQVAFLSRQLLGFRRSGDLELKRVPITDVVTRALSNASAALTDVELRTRLDYTGVVRCSPPMLTQVLVNLLENGAHAAGRGGWIELVVERAHGHISIDLADSGAGVAPELREKIFEPFFTTKPPGQGTGLGLSTSRDLIHRHGGTLEVRVRGDRTVFAVSLPEPREVS